MTRDQLEKYWRFGQIALFLGLDSSACYRLAQRGAFAAVYDGGKWYGEIASVQRYKREREQPAAEHHTAA